MTASPGGRLGSLAALVAGPLGFLAAWPLGGGGGALEPEAARVLGLAAWMVIWWVSEVVPLGATSLLPLVVLPLFGVVPTREAAAPYANELIFLFLAGFLLAGALERWRCHERIAYSIVRRMGTGARQVMAGVMLATAFLSMWISNTATAAMMFPIVVAIGGFFARDPGGDRARIGLLLGMAWAATIGGMGTLIGTPPNLILAGSAQELTGQTIDFGRFMLVGIPLVVVLLPVTWAMLVFVLFPNRAALGEEAGRLLESKGAGLGPIRGGEAKVFVLFGLTALAWFFREPKDFGVIALPGLTQVAPMLTDAAVGIGAAILLFSLSGRTRTGGTQRLLTWDEARRIPWDVLLLFGGGLSLAAAMDATGLTSWIAGQLVALAGLPLPVLFLGMGFVIVALGEFASNTAMAAVMMPLMVSLGAAVGQPPLLLMLVAGLTASLGFALPVATPPNAIVFGSGMVPMRQMVRAGLILDVVTITITVLLLSVLAPLVFPGS